MQAVALILLLAILGAGTLLALARQGRLPARLRTIWDRRSRPAWLPQEPGLKVLDRIPVSPGTALIRLELEDGTRLLVAVGGPASLLHEEPPSRQG